MFDVLFQLANTILYAFVAWLMAYAAFTSPRLAPFYGGVSLHFFVIVVRAAMLALYHDQAFWRYIHFTTISVAVMVGIVSYVRLHRGAR